MKKPEASRKHRKPRILGTGLIALDVVVTSNGQRSPRCYAGGTCGNVLTILSYLGWSSLPMSRLAPGRAAERMITDLREWNVSTRFISLSDSGSTPVIIHQICKKSDGKIYHTFSWRCPVCGAHLPGYKPVLAATVNGMKKTPKAEVFFFDRASRAAVQLAKATREQGGLVVFEPSGVGAPHLFREAWSLAHIVKYSQARLRDIADLGLGKSEPSGILLEIETLGAEGMRYRSRLSKCRTKEWQCVNAFKAPLIKDEAGAGDWFTAGILCRLAAKGLRGFQATTADQLDNAIKFAQALAAWNCGFEGARGGMYRVDKRTFKRHIREILAGDQSGRSKINANRGSLAKALSAFCPSCNLPHEVKRVRQRNTVQSH